MAARLCFLTKRHAACFALKDVLQQLRHHGFPGGLAALLRRRVDAADLVHLVSAGVCRRFGDRDPRISATYTSCSCSAIFSDFMLWASLKWAGAITTSSSS